MKKPYYTLWGSELSPFYLKTESCLRYCNIPIVYQPQDGGFFKALASQLRVKALTKGWTKITWPIMSALDELPLVPFMFDDKNNAYYDSTAFAHWLDKSQAAKNLKLATFTDHSIEFVVALIDEYADDFGLYMAHHMRWKKSAKTNTAGKRLAAEFKKLLGPLTGEIEKQFPPRQVRRLPYLFSSAPDGFTINDLPPSLQPPVREGFPETHSLLEDAFDRLLSALESILSQRDYLLGGRFTLADASIYGQLAMNLADPCAANYIQQNAPSTYQWLVNIRAGKFPQPEDHKLVLDTSIKPLLDEIQRVFIPLMQQNENAYEKHYKQGQRLFNEQAFDHNEALYDGEVDGKPFRSVAKSFQVASWRELVSRWNSLEDQERKLITDVAPINLQPNSDSYFI
jgi:glutathione S-transferase